MNLLLDEVSVLETRGDPASVEVTDIVYDSRRAVPGCLFCCVPGTTADGHDFAADAVGRGAAGLVCEHFVTLGPAGGRDAERVVQARVAAGAVRPTMARLAAAFYDHPSREVTVAGVTGTNGKTTVTTMLAGILAAAGTPCTVIGTLTGSRTTPEAPELQRVLAALRDDRRRDGRARGLAMEVSSHALVQARVDAIDFDVAVFTNLSHDHLDYHGTMEAYGRAKASLFEPGRARRGVVNVDDPFGRRLAADARIPVVAVRRSDAADVELAAGRTSFTWRGQRVRLRTTGLVNVDNALLAAEAAVVLGVDPATVAAGLGQVDVVPGRLELVHAAGDPGFSVLVDYAHTPAALEAVLAEARRLAGAGAVLVVFGCGGDRDRAKRPLMGAAAAAGADTVVVTSDNPRSEDPGAIIDEVCAGIPAGVARLVEPDRRRAIATAIGRARRGDVVVIAGKGHETVQQVGDAALPFDDRLVAAEILAAGADAAGGRG